MDYLFSALIDPIELDEYKKNKPKKKGSFPDAYRGHLFCLEKPIKYYSSPKTMAKITNTKEKYWHNNDLKHKIISMIDDYEKLPEHILTNYLDNPIDLPESIQKYYHKIYTLADIIIIKTKNNNDYKSLTTVIKIVLDKIKKSVPISHRLVFYLSTYLIKNHPSHIKKFPSVLIKKIEEFLNEPDIWKYFTLIELDDYMCYVKELEKRINNIK